MQDNCGLASLLSVHKRFKALQDVKLPTPPCTEGIIFQHRQNLGRSRHIYVRLQALLDKHVKTIYFGASFTFWCLLQTDAVNIVS